MSKRRKLTLSYRREPATNSVGFCAIEDAVFPPESWTPPYTAETVRDMFPTDRWTKQDKPADFGDDGALWQRVVAALATNRKQSSIPPTDGKRSPVRSPPQTR